MTQTLEQLIERKNQLLEKHENLKKLQKFLDILLESETPLMRCSILLNMCKHQTRLLQDTMALINTDVEEVQQLCSELPSIYLK